MEKKFKRTLVTTALPYANGPVHIGHLAGVYVPADIYTRYLRLKGEEVIHIGGSDEHGVPITLKAKAEGITPQDVVDRYHSIIKNRLKSLEFLSIYIPVPLPISIRKQLPSFSGNCMIRVFLSRRRQSSIMMKRPSSSLPTVILPVLVRIVRMKGLMAISVKPAEHL